MAKQVGNILNVEYREAKGAKGDSMGVYQFVIDYYDGQQFFAEAVPTNRFYYEVKEWYDGQKAKPFKFKFKELA